MRRIRILTAITLLCALAFGGSGGAEPLTFFRDHVGLTQEQIAKIEDGNVVVKLLPSSSSAEVYIFGAVLVKGKPEDYVRLAMETDRLQRAPGYMGAGRISNPPRAPDLEGFSLEPGDIRDLKRCKPGDCAIQLSGETMAGLLSSINWNSPNVDADLNGRMQMMALDLLTGYLAQGDCVLGVYRDKDEPFDVCEELRSLVGNVSALPAYLPGLSHYLLEYPKATLPQSDSFFYWEKVRFGLKPTLRLNHIIHYRVDGPRVTGEIIVSKQLYASHYFQLALDLTACIPGKTRTGQPAFYLISLRGSRQHGLTGFFGSILRAIIVARTRSAQSKVLLSIKTMLEEAQP